MKNLSEPAIDKFRLRDEDARRGVRDGDRQYGGAFLVPFRTHGRLVNLLVIAARGDKAAPEEEHRFDHVSVSHNDRTPTWEEMDYMKRLFFHPDEVAYQLHVPARDNVNNHAYCLHLWRHVTLTVPMPPPILVGVPRTVKKYA